jgi:hypothetical protein
MGRREPSSSAAPVKCGYALTVGGAKAGGAERQWGSGAVGQLAAHLPHRPVPQLVQLFDADIIFTSHAKDVARRLKG